MQENFMPEIPLPENPMPYETTGICCGKQIGIYIWILTTAFAMIMAAGIRKGFISYCSMTATLPPLKRKAVLLMYRVCIFFPEFGVNDNKRHKKSYQKSIF